MSEDLPVVANPAVIPKVEAPKAEPTAEEKLGTAFADIISKSETEMSDAIAAYVAEQFPAEGGTKPAEEGTE